MKEIIINKNILKKYVALLVIVCFISMFEMDTTSTYENGILSAFYGTIYSFATYFIYVVYAFDLIKFYDKNDMIFLRLKDKNEYFERLFDYCLKNLIVIYLVLNLTMFFFSNVNLYFITGKFTFNFQFLLYLIYNLSKVFIILELIIKIGLLLYKSINIKVAGMFLMLIQVLKYFWEYNMNIVDSFGKVHLFYGYYLIPISYNTIFLDIFSFVLQVIILLGIIEFIKYLTLKYKKVYIEG